MQKETVLYLSCCRLLWVGKMQDRSSYAAYAALFFQPEVLWKITRDAFTKQMCCLLRYWLIHVFNIYIFIGVFIFKETVDGKNNDLTGSKVCSATFVYLNRLGPGRPSAGGPRMDRQAVTSPGVVQIWRLASRLRRSARRGPDPTAVLTLIKCLMIMPEIMPSKILSPHISLICSLLLEIIFFK